VEGDGVLGVDDVAGAGAGCELVAAGDVVVVDVGLDHHLQPQATPGQQRVDAVDVALRVDDHRDGTVVREVAAVPELLGGDHFDIQHADPPSKCPYILLSKVDARSDEVDQIGTTRGRNRCGRVSDTRRYPTLWSHSPEATFRCPYI